MDLQSIINRTIQAEAERLYSQLTRLYTKEADPKDVFEQIVAIGPQLGEILSRNHRALGITQAISSASPSDSVEQSQLEHANDSELAGESQPAGWQDFPVVTPKSERPRSQQKRAQSADRNQAQAEEA